MTPETNSASKPLSLRTLTIADIQKLLPHRYPFLLVDTIDILEEGKKAVGTKCVTFNEEFFQGHFPGRPIMPGVLIVEALAQTCSALIANRVSSDNKIAFFLGIENAKFRAPVTPGSVLSLRVEAVRIGGRAGKFRGEAYLGDKLAAEAEVLLAMVDK